jgi:hypothetical protein
MEKRSILDGARRSVREALAGAMQMPDIGDLIESIKSNWSNEKARGKLNWHLRHVALPKSTDTIRKVGHSPGSEVLLERQILGAFDGTECLWNQMPVASGLLKREEASVKGREEPRRAVDLVYMPDKSVARYQLLELKVARNKGRSDSFFAAAIEVIEYGLLYLFSRKYRDELGYSGNAYRILDASRIDLRVIAPQGYFDIADVRSELNSFPFASVNDALKSYAPLVASNFQMDLGVEVISLSASNKVALKAAILEKKNITPVN